MINHQSVDSNKLAVLWTTAERKTALDKVLPYTQSAKEDGWFDAVRLVVWGPSVRLLARYQDLTDIIIGMMDAGVEVAVCTGSARRDDAFGTLEAMGATVLPAGEHFSKMIQPDWKVLSM